MDVSIFVERTWITSSLVSYYWLYPRLQYLQRKLEYYISSRFNLNWICRDAEFEFIAGRKNGSWSQQKDTDVTNRGDPLEHLDQVKIDNTIESSTSAIRSVFRDFKKQESSFSEEDLRKVEKKLRVLFVGFYQKLHHLKNYRWWKLIRVIAFQ